LGGQIPKTEPEQRIDGYGRKLGDLLEGVVWRWKNYHLQ